MRGEQTQRAVGAYAFHQTHSVKRKEAEERKLHSCTVCAVSHWTDDLRKVMLFVKPTKCSNPKIVENVQEEEEEEEGEPLPEVSVKDRSWKVVKLEAAQIEHIHQKIFDVRRYEEAYPRIPKEEIRGSCVTHPSGKYEDGSPWLWLLDSKHVVQPVSHDTVCYVCNDCSQALLRKKPVMPKFALANYLWIGRYPPAFLWHGKPLSAMTWLLLALGRPVIQKVIAEKQKPGPVQQKQKGIRANTIAFPQAILRELATTQLPPAADVVQRHLRDTISIALVGCDPEADGFG